MNKDVFLGLVVVSLIGTVIFLLVRFAWRSNLNADSLTIRDKMMFRMKARKDFIASHLSYSKTASKLLAIDEANQQVAQYLSKDQQIYVRNIKISEIISLHLNISEQLSITGLGAAIDTGSSVIGTGKAISQRQVSNITLRFYIYNTDTPFFDHEFLTSARYGKFEEESGYVQEALTEANRMKSILDVLLHRQSKSI